MKSTKIKKNTINKLKQRTLRSFDHLSVDNGKKVHIRLIFPSPFLHIFVYRGKEESIPES